MGKNRANPIATLTAAPTIVNTPSNIQSVTYTGLIPTSRQTTIPQQITVPEPTTLPDPINATPVHAPTTDTAIEIPHTSPTPAKPAYCLC